MDKIYAGCSHMHESYGKETLYYCDFGGKPSQTHELYHSSCEGCFIFDIYKRMEASKTNKKSKENIDAMNQRPLRS